MANAPQNVQALEWQSGYARRLVDSRTRAWEATLGQVPGGEFGGGLVTFFHTRQGLTKTSTWTGGFGHFIPRGAKQVDAGWHLAKFLGSDERELTWTQGTLALPVRVNVAKAKYFQDRVNTYREASRTPRRSGRAR